MKLTRVAWGLATLALGTGSAAAQVTTSQYDNLRTGATLKEKVLTPQNVKATGPLTVRREGETTATRC